MSLLKELQHLKISLEELKSATNNFGDSNIIGEGGFGKVYKGELLLSGQLTMVAVKRFQSAYDQGSREFDVEMMTLSSYKHENLVSLLGFCDESGERSLVYEYLPNKSLDFYLSSTDLSWNQRLRICIGAAHGLHYLHDGVALRHRIIHRDISSSNILLDQNWNAKIAGFGISKSYPSNQEFTFIVTSVPGSMGYLDPEYAKTGFLTKESDVYSFGVVLFEVLCGRLSVQNYQDIRRFLSVLARKHYEEKKLDKIIPTSIKTQISPACLETLSAVAYQCLLDDRKERPSMAVIVKELEIALQYQVEYERDKEKELLHYEEDSESDEGEYWETKLPQDWKIMITRFNIPRAVHTIKRELFSLLHKGILFDEGNKFLWIDNDGKKCVLISARRFLKLDEGSDHSWVFQQGGLRFPVVAAYHYGKWHEIRCQIKTSILSIGSMYAAKLVFKYSKKPNEDLKYLKLMRIYWKMEDLSVCSIHNAELTQDNWYKIRMWNFLNQDSKADFDIVIEELSYYDDPVESDILIQGIEFQPIEMMQHEEIEGIKSPLILDKEEKDDDLYWEKKLPKDYQNFVQMLDTRLHYTSKKELYFLLCEGFPAYGGKLYSSLCKSTGGICSILPATHILCRDASYESLETLSLSGSRFREVKVLGTDDWYLFTCRLRPFMFSPHYLYACYLMFKFEGNQILSDDDRFFKAEYKLGDNMQGIVFAHLTLTPTINIPTIKPKNDHGSHDPSSNLPTISEELEMIPKGLMEHSLNDSWVEERKDGWMELRLCKPLPQLETHNLLEVKFWKSKGGSFSGIIVEGMEFRPMHDVSNL